MSEQEVTQEVDQTPPSPAQRLLDETGMAGKVDQLGGTEESPVLDKTVQGDDDGHPDASTGTPEDTAPVSDDGTDWKKRHGDAVRWAQQLKQEKERLQQEHERLMSERRRLEEAGLDFDEINRFIESQGGTPVRRQEMDTSTSKQQQGVQQGSYVTTDQLNTVLTRYNYDMAKRDFAEANQEFRDPDAQDLLDIESARLAQSEIFQYGRVNSRVDDIVKEAAKKVTAKLNKFKALGARSVTERREKIKEAAIPEGQSIAKSGAKDDEETYSPTKGFASLVTDHRKKFKQRGMR